MINDAALAYMKGRDLSQIVIDKLIAHRARIFASSATGAPSAGAGLERDESLARSGLDRQRGGAVGRDPSIRACCRTRSIVSDDAGQFRVGAHALCWVHAERLVHKLIPATDKQRNAVEVAKRMIWWFYRCLKDYKLSPAPIRPNSCAPASSASSSAPNRVRHARQPAQTPLSPQRRTVARARAAGNPAQHQRLGKRHPRLRHQAKNIRRDRQRPRPRRPRHHARSGQNLHEIEIVVLRLHRRPTRHSRSRNPTTSQPSSRSANAARKFATITKLARNPLKFLRWDQLLRIVGVA